jgi:hypothetical protein
MLHCVALPPEGAAARLGRPGATPMAPMLHCVALPVEGAPARLGRRGAMPMQ